VCLLVGLWLPPLSHCDKVFLAQILIGKRRVLHKRDVPRSTVPQWNELSFAFLWPQLQADSRLLEFLPDCLPGGKPHNRAWLLGILQVLRPAYVEALIGEARVKRAGQNKLFRNSQTLLHVGITREMAQLLLAEPFVSRK